MATRPIERPNRYRGAPERGGEVAEATEQMSIEEALQRCVGQVTTRATVVVERGPVSCFADAVLEESPIYRDPAAARAAGFSNIPAPPTFPWLKA